MKTYNIHEAKTHLSRLVEAAAGGEEIVIAKAGKPMAKLVAVSASGGPRELGALAGAVREAPDCWAPDPELEALFYGTEPRAGPRRRVAEPPRQQDDRPRRRRK
jgi:prevent-host-death family protein